MKSGNAGVKHSILTPEGEKKRRNHLISEIRKKYSDNKCDGKIMAILKAAGSDTRPPMLDRTDYESWSQRIRLYCRGKENGLQILQSIDEGPFELGTTRNTLGTTLEGDVRATNIVLQGLPKDITSSSITTLKQKQFGTTSKCFLQQLNINKGLKETNHEQLYAYLKQHEKHAAQDRLIIERITPTANDQLAFVSTVQPYAPTLHVQSHQYPSSSATPQSPQFPHFLETNQATIQDGRVVVQNDQGRQNQNQNQIYFARGNGAAGNGGAQNRAGNANAGQGKPVKCYNCNGLGHIARNCTQPKRLQNSDYFKDKMLLMQAQENGAVLDEEELLFMTGEQANTFDADVDNQPVQDLALNEDNIFQAYECDAFDSDVDDEPTAQSIFMDNLSLARLANQQAGPSNASILSEVHILENAIDHSVTNLDEPSNGGGFIMSQQAKCY
ncbi:retrovirus-related pol polyprotein from transposon TNT 1-94 [Tanacetum coccineum]